MIQKGMEGVKGLGMTHDNAKRVGVVYRRDWGLYFILPGNVCALFNFSSQSNETFNVGF